MLPPPSSRNGLRPEPSLSESDIATIGEGLDAHNARYVCAPVVQWFVERDEGGRLRGGLKAQVQWNWLLIDWLWVDERHRRQGIGTRLIDAAEAYARTMQLHGTYLNTFTFQAPAFYLERGYRVLTRIDDFAPGHARLWLAKRMDDDHTLASQIDSVTP